VQSSVHTWGAFTVYSTTASGRNVLAVVHRATGKTIWFINGEPNERPS